MNALEKVGRVSKPFGQSGELILSLYDSFPIDLNIEEPLFAKFDSLTVPLFFDKFERRGKNGALVKFADFETDARSSELIGKEIFAVAGKQTQENDDDDELYFEDLVGYSASFDGEELRGTITSYIDSELNPLFEITANGKEIYVPAVEEMIIALDIEKKEIEFSLPEGLLELYL